MTNADNAAMDILLTPVSFVANEAGDFPDPEQADRRKSGQPEAYEDKCSVVTHRIVIIEDVGTKALGAKTNRRRPGHLLKKSHGLTYVTKTNVGALLTHTQHELSRAGWRCRHPLHKVADIGDEPIQAN